MVLGGDWYHQTGPNPGRVFLVRVTQTPEGMWNAIVLASSMPRCFGCRLTKPLESREFALSEIARGMKSLGLTGKLRVVS